MWEWITILSGAIEKLLDLLLELAWLMVHRHEHHICREWVVGTLAKSFDTIIWLLFVEQALDRLDLLYRHAFGRVHNANQRQLRMSVLKVDGIG